MSENATSEDALALDQEESSYLRGGKEPQVGSLLRSTSKYLNHSAFRDLFAQQALRRLGSDVPAAFLVPEFQKAMGELTDYPKIFAGIESARGRIPEFARWLDERFVSDLKPEDLKDYAPGTLGARVYDFISTSGMQIDFMFLGEPKNDFEYINKRRIQTHDILHMVTGLDTSTVGEIALNVANVTAESNYYGDTELFGAFSVSAMWFAVTSLMRVSCHYPAVLPVMLEGYSRGYQLGSKQKKPLFMINWEPYFDWEIEDIREEFSFQDGPADGAWTWTGPASQDPV